MDLCDLTYIARAKSERQAHLKLGEPCCMRGTDSIQCRGLLAHYLDTTVPKNYKIVLAHACHNADCCNPNHLYWATRSENEQDKWAGPNAAVFRKQNSQRATGAKNSQFGKKPWLVQNAHVHSWKQAQYLYENYFLKGWDFSKYGQGVTYFCSEYGLAQGSCKAMIKMFRAGWVPNQDNDWILHFKMIDEL